MDAFAVQSTRNLKGAEALLMTNKFLNLMRVPEATKAVMDLVADRTGAERIETALSCGTVAAEEITAPEDLPGFARSGMDGFAVLSSDSFGATEGLPAYLRITGEVPMGPPGALELEPGCAVRISTGGALPPGSDAVVMVENTEVSGPTVEITKAVAPGENVLGSDEDVPRGALLIRRGQVLGPAQVGVLAGLGITSLKVFKTPRIAVLSTGDELVPPDATPALGQVRDINTWALCASVEGAGCGAVPTGIAADSLDGLLAACRSALARSDALLVSGGSSAGIRDLTMGVIEELGSPGVLAHGIHLKPGKPTIAAVCDGKPVFGLPGNPASALAVFRELVVPVLRKLRGEGPPYLQVPATVDAVMDRSHASDPGRMELLPVELRPAGGDLLAVPVAGKSMLIGTLARAQGHVRIPEGSEGLEKGEVVQVELLERCQLYPDADPGITERPV